MLELSSAEVGVVVAAGAMLSIALHFGAPQQLVNVFREWPLIGCSASALRVLKGNTMKQSTKLPAGMVLPQLRLPAVGGGEFQVGGSGGWQMLVVYRGKHCPLCKKYLKTLDGLLDGFRATGTRVVVASGDPKEKAESEAAEEGWRFPVGYAMTQEQMRTLGLYVSEPRSPQETDRPFPEPGLFVINPEGQVQIVDVSNAPFSRPDLANILSGLKLIMEKNYPIRGTAA